MKVKPSIVSKDSQKKQQSKKNHSKYQKANKQIKSEE